jgi:hypothetical protein
MGGEGRMDCGAGRLGLGVLTRRPEEPPTNRTRHWILRLEEIEEGFHPLESPD